MKKKKLTLTEEINEMKKVMKDLLKEEDLNLNKGDKFYGDVVSHEFLSDIEKEVNGDFSVLVTTQKGGVDYMQMELGFDIELISYKKPYRSYDYYEPDYDGELEYDITLVDGKSSLIPDPDSDMDYEFKPLSKEELSVIESDKVLINTVYNMESVSDLAWDMAESKSEVDYDPSDDYDPGDTEAREWGGMDI